MTALQLDDRQQALLDRILVSWISDLKMEIGSTEDFDYRQKLHADKDLAISILAQINPAAARQYQRVS
ncbi:MAG TPA: hypothetical protein VFH62_03935 [Dehalococcoidia bacterium]|jgi:hypothetical protein|nr:hypothetical protein [Dehalococcoidia bacterium]